MVFHPWLHGNVVVLLEGMRSYLTLNAFSVLYRAVEVSYVQNLEWNENVCLSFQLSASF